MTKKNISKNIFWLMILITLTSCRQNTYVRTLDDIKKRGVITVVTNADFYPFEYFKADKVVGIDMDISEEIAKDIGVKLEILEMNFDGVVAAIAYGKSDFVAAGLTKDEEKASAIDFSDGYINVSMDVISLSNSGINKLEDLKGKKIGTQMGTTSDKYISKEIKYGYLKNTGAKLIQKKEYLDLLVDLKNNRIHAIALDRFIAKKLMEKNEGLQFFERANETYCLAVKRGNYTLLNQINQTLKRLIKENKIEKFSNAHLDITP